MYLFRHRGERLQPGLVNSMRELLVLDLSGLTSEGYLYHDSDAWKDWRTLLWHNK